MVSLLLQELRDSAMPMKNLRRIRHAEPGMVPSPGCLSFDRGLDLGPGYRAQRRPGPSLSQCFQPWGDVHWHIHGAPL